MNDVEESFELLMQNIKLKAQNKELVEALKDCLHNLTMDPQTTWAFKERISSIIAKQEAK